MSTTHVGRSVRRIEDESLLRGAGRFADDVGEPPGTGHAVVVRSPHAHARIISLDVSEALALDGVYGVLTGAEAALWSRPFVAGVKQPMEHRAIALDLVRYVGEPVAVVIAENRYRAEDAAERVLVDYEPLDTVVDPLEAAAPDAPVLHDAVGSNVVSDRSFRYGDPDTAFEEAQHRITLDVTYPRNACTPIEGFVVLAEHLAGDDTYDVLSNFQGPFSLHAVMARALNVSGTKLRLRTPRDSGGSYGVKQAVFPYVVALCLASRLVGRPVKWVEDRMEHLVAATSATNRVTHIEAAVDDDGRIRALAFDQLDDCGAYLRAPEPASLYRMHGHMTGAYDIEHVAVRNRVVLTNKTPTGLNRGFGGPQVYFALERLVQHIAVTLKRDPLDVVRRNLITGFPFRTAQGALYDSGDYRHSVATAIHLGGLAELRAKRDAARAEGRLYGIGFAAVVEPSISNMGYITTVLTPEERERAGPKDGALATATVSIDPTGSVAVSAASTPQGQGHRTVLSQVVADVLGLEPADIQVNVELDTAKDAWSIASGNYSSRFAGAVAGAAHLAAVQLRERIARIASAALNVPAEELEFAGAEIRARDNRANKVAFRRLVGASHWSQSALPEGAGPGLRETAFWSLPQLTPPDEHDRINSSGVYGFIFDYCGVEVDRITGAVHIDSYVTMHDAGRRLHPAMVDGQIRGAFAHAVGAALYESFDYSEDGDFLSGSFADYLVPTACEVPDPVILHTDSPSPLTPLGAKGVGEGNCMSTPVCIANAVADALGTSDVTLPLQPARLCELVDESEGSP